MSGEPLNKFGLVLDDFKESKECWMYWMHGAGYAVEVGAIKCMTPFFFLSAEN